MSRHASEALLMKPVEEYCSESCNAIAKRMLDAMGPETLGSGIQLRSSTLQNWEILWLTSQRLNSLARRGDP